jgi:rare lipoprotein A (peptidoglycan hydrolase)
MQTTFRSRSTGLACGVTCLLLPLAVLPPTDSEFATVASWYGPGFQGRKTASGERFDTNKMTAASRQLPFGTEVLVRNPRNGRSCQVTINDRGPYVKGRAIDLSHAAAQRLGISGIAPVICYTGAARNRAAGQPQQVGDVYQADDAIQAVGSSDAVLASYNPSPTTSAVHYRYRSTPAHRKERRTAPSQYIASRPTIRSHHRTDRSQQYIAYHQPGRFLHHPTDRSQQYISYHASKQTIAMAPDPPQDYISSPSEHSKFHKAFSHIGHGVAHLFTKVKYGILASL